MSGCYSVQEAAQSRPRVLAGVCGCSKEPFELRRATHASPAIRRRARRKRARHASPLRRPCACNARAYLDATISLNCAITSFGVSPMRAISVRTAVAVDRAQLLAHLADLLDEGTVSGHRHET